MIRLSILRVDFCCPLFVFCFVSKQGVGSLFYRSLYNASWTVLLSSDRYLLPDIEGNNEIRSQTCWHRAVSETLRGFVDADGKAAVLLGTRFVVLPRCGGCVRYPVFFRVGYRATLLVAQRFGCRVDLILIVCCRRRAGFAGRRKGSRSRSNSSRRSRSRGRSRSRDREVSGCVN